MIPEPGPRDRGEKEDGEKLKAELKEKLLTFAYNENGGEERILRGVFSKEEIYSGPYLEAAPDLVLISKHGYDLKGSIKRKELFGRSEGLCGMHTQDDAFFFINRPQVVVKDISEAGKLLSQTLV